MAPILLLLSLGLSCSHILEELVQLRIGRVFLVVCEHLQREEPNYMVGWANR